MAKRAREIAVKERRDRKRAKKAEAAALRAAGIRAPEPVADGLDGQADSPEVEADSPDAPADRPDVQSAGS
ncbi:MAG: hypothetical protein ACXVZ1_08150 [Gaiellaceae bacterium]